MSIYVAKNGQLQTIKGIYYGMTEDYISATLFHNLVPKTATEIRFLYASDNPDLTDYQKLGYCDNNNFIEVWNYETKYIIINPRKNYIYAPVDCSHFLHDYTVLTNCVFNNFDTRNTTIMTSMFFDCYNLISLNLSSFNTQNVTYMNNMFAHCRTFPTLDVTNFNTQNVKLMGAMFFDCRSLTTLDLSNFKTDNVTSMYEMFYNCRGLTSIISNTFNTAALTRYQGTFNFCTSLVGGNGTTYNRSHIDAEYARVDGEDGLPGYFTAPN